MELKLYKDDEFKTVGFQVYHGEDTVYHFGRSWECWEKSVSYDNNAQTIFEIISIYKEFRFWDGYVSKWFETWLRNKDKFRPKKKEEQGINFQEEKKKVEMLKQELNRLLQKLA